MKEDTIKRLLEAAETGTIEDVRIALEGCSDDEVKQYGKQVLNDAVQNKDPQALDIVKLLMDRGCETNVYTLNCAAGNKGLQALAIVKLLMDRGCETDKDTLKWAAGNKGPQALDIVKLLMESGCKHPDGECVGVHGKGICGYTAFTAALLNENSVVADYLLSRDDFLPSDFMPRDESVSPDIYKVYRKKAISRVVKSIDEKGIKYAKIIATDIEEILKTENLKPTKEDIKALEPLVGKISSRDWVAGAQVKCDDFLDCNVER